MHISFSSVKQASLAFPSTDPVYVVLNALSSATSSQNAEELVSATGLTKRNVSTALASLMTKGLVYEEQDEHFNLSRYGRGMVSHMQETPQEGYDYTVPTQRAYNQIFTVLSGTPLTGEELSGIVKTAPAKAALQDLITRGFVVFDAASDTYSLSSLGEAHTTKTKEQGEFSKNTEPVLVAKDMSSAQFNLMKQMYEYFRQQHPEYSYIYSIVDKSEDNMRSFFNDVRKFMRGGKIEKPRFNSIEPLTRYWGGNTIPEQASLEAAFAHEIRYMAANVAHVQKSVPKMSDIKLGRNYVTLLGQKATPARLKSALKAFPPGTVLSTSDVQAVGAKIVGQPFPSTLNTEGAAALISQTLTSRRDPQSGVFFPDDATLSISAELVRRLKSGEVAVLEAYVNSADNAGGSEDVLSAVFASGSDYSNVQLPGISFSKVDELEGVNFSGSNLSGAVFHGVKVKDCHFEGANLTGADFTGATLTGNYLEGADFTNVSGLDDEDTTFDVGKNIGRPKNLIMRKVQYATDALPNLYKMQPVGFYTHNVVRTPEDELSARAMAQIIREHLNERGVMASLRFGASPPPEGVSDEQVQQLKNWVASPTDIPAFIANAGASMPDPMVWFAKMNKAKAFTGRLTQPETQALFGLFRGLTGKKLEHGQEKPAGEEKSKPKERPTVESLVSKFKAAHGNKPISIDDLKALILDPNGALAQYLDTQATNKTDARALYGVYTTLIGSLSGFHTNSGVQPVRPYATVPVRSYVANLTSTQYSVGGAGKQFGIAMVPDYSQMPGDLANITHKAIDAGATHLAHSVGFSRITPLRYTQQEGEPGTTAPQKYVWYISEMQNDAYQKAHRGISEDDNTKFRSYFASWPENLLNLILEYATREGVDEVWMPKHQDVEKKTKGRSSDEAPNSVPNWSMAYDRPAKAFGGKLTPVGVSLTLDPASSYDQKASEFYVIPIKKAEKQGAVLEEAGMLFLKFAAITPAGFNNMKHHIKWFIEHNRVDAAFQPYEAYVTDQDMAQWAYNTYFGEYHVERTPEHEQELKAFIAEEFGYTITDPQFDFLHWVKKAEDDIQHFIRNTSEMQGGAVGKEELGRDWYQDWTENTVIPAIKESPMKQHYLDVVTRMLKDRGYGDVTLTGYAPPSGVDDRTQQIINPVDTGDEGEIVGPDGKLIPGSENAPKAEEVPPEIRFSPPGEREQRNMAQAEIDRLLDKLQVTQDENEKARIRRQLHELSTLASLRFSAIGEEGEEEEIDTMDLGFSPPGVREQKTLVQGEIDRLLDRFLVTQDAVEKERIRRQLYDLSTLASLRFASLVSNAVVVHEDGKWKVKTHDKSRTLGTHDTEDEANAQLRAIEISKHATLTFASAPRLKIQPVTVEDHQRVLALRANVFSVVSSAAPPDTYYAGVVDWALCRKVASEDGTIVGAYLLGRRQMPDVLATIPGMVVHEDLYKYADKRGVEGVSVFIEKPFRGVIGSKLLDVPYQIEDADYIWGFANKLLGNISNWKRRRRVIAENDQMYVTVVDLQPKLTFSAVDQEFNRPKNEQKETPRNDWWQYEPAHGEAAPVGGGSGGGGAADTSNMDMRGGFYTDLNLPDPHRKEKQVVQFEPSNHVNLEPSFIASFDFVQFKTSVMGGMRGLNEFKNLTDEQLTAKLQDEWRWAKRAGIV